MTPARTASVRRLLVPGGLAVALLVFLLATPAMAGAGQPSGEYYLAVGGSGSVGVQPTTAHPHGQPTHHGYTEDVLATERATWPGLRLVSIGCPGETTRSMIDGVDRCHYAAGSQLATAVAFLHQHRATPLITVDLGFNDLRPCMTGLRVDRVCVDHALVDVRQQLAQTLESLRAADDDRPELIGIGHYDPYLGAYFRGPAGRRFADESVGVIDQLNQVLDSVYADHGVRMAGVEGSYDTTDTTPTAVPGRGTVPRDVADICLLTWECAPRPLGPNLHPNQAGYQRIASAVDSALHP
jgi:lysophospholipase L1-like esterase